jgi:hypothetical protein
MKGSVKQTVVLWCIVEKSEELRPIVMESLNEYK